MPTFTASLDLDDDQTALLLRTAALFNMPLSEFLTAAFESGIAHAEHLMAEHEESHET